MAVAKEQIRQIISQNNLNSVADVYPLLKESFKDILQELMEAELDASLGYEKIKRAIFSRITNAMGIPKRHSKASIANSRWRFPETATVSLNRSSFPNIKEMYPVLKKKSSPCMQGA